MNLFRHLYALALLLALVSGCRTASSPTGNLLRPTFALPGESTQRINDVTIHVQKNGLTLIHRKTESNSIVGIVVTIRTGAREDDPAKAGLTNLMMRVLPKGTKTRSADDIAEEVGQLGAALSCDAGQDVCTVSLQCINSDLDEAMELLTDVILHPTFPVDEVDTERRRVLAGIRIGDDQPSVVAAKRFRTELFGGHPYAYPVDGLAETVPNLMPQDLFTKHQANFVTSNMVVSAVGNVDYETIRALTEKYLGEVMLEREQQFTANKIIMPGPSRTEVFKKSEQGFVVMGNRTCPAGDPDEPAIRVATVILGGGMSSRLFSELRDKQGLAYSIGASPAFYQLQGYVVASMGTSPDNLKPAEQPAPKSGTPTWQELNPAREPNPASHAELAMWEQIRLLREAPVSDEELDRARNYIAGQYLRAHERNMQQASYLAHWFILGKGVEYDEKYLDDIRAVTSRDVMRVANKYFLDPTVVILRPPGDGGRS